MADIHNEDMIDSLRSAFSEVKKALDTTVSIEQNPGMSSGDRTSNVVIIKAAIERTISILQNCGSGRYQGTPAPTRQLSSLRIEGIESTVTAGSAATTGNAVGDFSDHNGQFVAKGEPVLVTWASSDSGVVSINSASGVYSALVPGNVTITARHSEGAVASIPLVVI